MATVLPDSLGSGTTTMTYASFASNIDLVAEKGGPCRRIRVGSTGNLALRYADKSTDTIIGLTAGENLDVQAAAILSAGTTITSCTVFW